MNATGAVNTVLDALAVAGIDYMITGGLVANVYGIPRSTVDADIVIRMESRSFDRFAHLLPASLQLDPQITFETITRFPSMSFHYFRLVLLAPTLAFLLSFGGPSPALAGAEKTEQTPCFWQRDPKAGFDNEGRNHCAPVSIADGLVYLAEARDLNGLVDGTDHAGQIALVTDLAAEMDTDPTEGTNPDKILTGLLRYAGKRGFSFQRLELATWRGVSAKNKKYLVGAKPDLAWITDAVNDPDVVVVLNFGWYEEGKDGGARKRLGGHWGQRGGNWSGRDAV